MRDPLRKSLVKVCIEYVGRMPDELDDDALSELLAYAQIEKPPAKL